MNSWFQTSNLLLHHGIPNTTAVQEGNSHHSTKGKLLFALLCQNTTVGRNITCVHEYNSHCCTLLPATEIVTACTCGDVTLPSPPSTTQSLRQSLVVPPEMSLYHHFPQSLGQSAVPVNHHTASFPPVTGSISCTCKPSHLHHFLQLLGQSAVPVNCHSGIFPPVTGSISCTCKQSFYHRFPQSLGQSAVPVM